MLGTMNDYGAKESPRISSSSCRSVSAHTGQSFLRSLVTELARALEVDYAFVAELKKNAARQGADSGGIRARARLSRILSTTCATRRVRTS